MLAQGETVADACRRIGTTKQSHYRCLKEYGGLTMDKARRMKELEKENAWLRRTVSALITEIQCGLVLDPTKNAFGD